MPKFECGICGVRHKEAAGAWDCCSTDMDKARKESINFGKRHCCVGCPHGRLVNSTEAEVANDPTEAFYRCHLLSDCNVNTAWGENEPLCKSFIYDKEA